MTHRASAWLVTLERVLLHALSTQSTSLKLLVWVPTFRWLTGFRDPLHSSFNPALPPLIVDCLPWFRSIIVTKLNVTARADFIRRRIAVPRPKRQVISTNGARVKKLGIRYRPAARGAEAILFMRRRPQQGFAAESAVAMLCQFLFQSLLHVCSSQLARVRQVGPGVRASYRAENFTE